MSSAVHHVAPGFHSVTPYLIIRGAAEAIEFYKAVFGAEEDSRMAMPNGMIGHAEIRIDGSKVMLADEAPDMGLLSPSSIGGTAVAICLYVPDADAVFHKAVEAGARVLRPLADQFYGDRSGTFLDPWGHQWTVATHTEDLTEEQLRERMNAAMSGGDGAPNETQ